MTRVILVRHGQSQANADGVLAGRLESPLTAIGRDQALDVGRRLADLPLARAVVSPVLRTRQTADLALHARDVPIVVDDGVSEVDYGDWTGKGLADLATEPLWAQVQRHPAGVTFPNGESMAAMSARAVAAVRGHAAEVQDAALLVISHGDLIKAILADALGLHLDAFQRIVVDPASGVGRALHPLGAFVEAMNDRSAETFALAATGGIDAVPGGGG